MSAKPLPTAYLIRTACHTDHTRGILVVVNPAGDIIHNSVTLELPWRDNAPQVSCIPEGTYAVVSRQSEKFDWHYHVLDVPGREWILFHPGNYTRELRGCILPGTRFKHLDRDKIPDIINSRATLNDLLAAIGPKFTLHILSVPVPGGTLPEVTVRP